LSGMKIGILVRGFRNLTASKAARSEVPGVRTVLVVPLRVTLG
jgi:hypothetical protein